LTSSICFVRELRYGGGLTAQGVSFRKRDDLLFCWVQRGECRLIRPMLAPIHLRQDEFVPVRTTTPFTLTSDPSVKPEDSETTVAITQDTGELWGD
jgi:hypothetical protein